MWEDMASRIVYSCDAGSSHLMNGPPFRPLCRGKLFGFIQLCYGVRFVRAAYLTALTKHINLILHMYFLKTNLGYSSTEASKLEMAERDGELELGMS